MSCLVSERKSKSGDKAGEGRGGSLLKEFACVSLGHTYRLDTKKMNSSCGYLTAIFLARTDCKGSRTQIAGSTVCNVIAQNALGLGTIYK